MDEQEGWQAELEAVEMFIVTSRETEERGERCDVREVERRDTGEGSQ